MPKVALWASLPLKANRPSKKLFRRPIVLDIEHNPATPRLLLNVVVGVVMIPSCLSAGGFCALTLSSRGMLYNLATRIAARR